MILDPDTQINKSLMVIKKAKWERYKQLMALVKQLRFVQNEHARTMQYGLRNEALRIGKEVDKLLAELN